MTDIPREHPRYESLMTREKIVEGIGIGITSKQGLVAQGRGEAFDYLIGERTTESAAFAERAAVAHILLAENPIISVNGNTAALVPESMVTLADVTGATLEVNLFHRSDARVHRIIEHLKSHGAGRVLGGSAEKRLDLSHDRAIVDEEGIFSADVVLVPLEDGDRCQKLVEMGKVVISIDLNPLSRTSLNASVSIIDNVTRALQNMTQFARDMKHDSRESLQEVINSYDNRKFIPDALYAIQERLKHQAEERGVQWI
ncbi:phosphopantothenate/pantothenate synthetase [Methanolobus zinderi]|jgi:4-phosphopantoate--beta-alanine ligase|uniref:4-phosphopantoate--beta-alanine ligase n=1 Tax=Methanolobus zinderi TaxID=536044 RepID=A0A7D5I3I2_9EURY|nr:4-phosphopantoate--beta-alanine ligase [Methanolobus zinderi]QLC49388.1 phosphopantothenate/pantothenate synthetase [Methanolobus zinderi]